MVDTLQVTITNALYHVSLSHFAKVQDQRERLGEVIRQANHWLVPAIFPCLILVAVFGTDIVGFLLDEAWLPAGPAAQILAIGAIIQLRRLMDHVALNALGRSGIALQAYLLEACLTTAGLFLFMPSMLWVVALFRAVQPLYGFCLIVYRSMRLTMRRWQSELLDLAVDLLLTLGTAVVVWNVRPYLAAQPMIVTLVIEAVIAMIAAGLLCALLRPAMVRHAWSALRRHPRFLAFRA
jgi:O-antigen/teichoic acid export membrane protein